MKKYIVNRREVHIQPVEVIANDADEALRRVIDGEGDDSFAMDFSHTLDTEYWTVDEGSAVLYRYEVTHRLASGALEKDWYWAEDAKHALEQWEDYASGIGDVTFHALTQTKETLEV